MKKLIILPFLLFFPQAYSSTIKVMHYNIKELDSAKIKNLDPQVKSVRQIVKKFNVDILSINEIQYDYNGVPTPNFTSTAKNLINLRKLLGLDHLNYTSFHPANTGKNALTKKDGTYYLKPNTAIAREHADPINFGTVPGQYSTGLISKFKIINEKIISDLKWIEFNPSLDLSGFKTAKGNSVPRDILLFDKNFSDITVEVDNKLLHLILLHTVPSFHFGNKHSINYKRNADQLRFLEWYLTGKTDFNVKLKSHTPLEKDSYFITAGDFNVAHDSIDSEGAVIIKRLINNTVPWIDKESMSFTNEDQSFAKKPKRLMLDYIFTSTNITKKNTQIIHPNFTRDELGCDSKKLTHKQVKNGMIVVDYLENNKKCSVALKKEYKLFKEASDHFPIYGEFELK